MGILQRLVLPLLVLAATASATSDAHAVGYVGIAPPGTSFGPELSLAALPGSPPPDIVERVYNNVATDDGPPQTLTVTGWSLMTILGAGQHTAESFNVLEIRLLTGRSLLLTGEQVVSGSGYSDGPPVISEVDGQAQILVPSTDGEVGQTVTAPTVATKLHTGALLAVDAGTSTLRAKVGETIRFNALATGTLDGETLNYRWNFDDGSGAPTATANHAFAVPGTYNVYVSVSGDQDSIGLSAVLPVVVGKAAKGPDRSGGGTNTKSTAPKSGVGVGGGKQRGAVKGRGTEGTSQTGSAQIAGLRERPQPPDLRPAERTSTRERRKPKRRSKPAAQPVASNKPMLSGIVLRHDEAASVAARRVQAAEAGVAEPARSGRPRSASNAAAIVSALAVLAALAAGVLLELREAPILACLRARLRASTSTANFGA